MRSIRKPKVKTIIKKQIEKLRKEDPDKELGEYGWTWDFDLYELDEIELDESDYMIEMQIGLDEDVCFHVHDNGDAPLMYSFDEFVTFIHENHKATIKRKNIEIAESKLTGKFKNNLDNDEITIHIQDKTYPSEHDIFMSKKPLDVGIKCHRIAERTLTKYTDLNGYGDNYRVLTVGWKRDKSKFISTYLNEYEKRTIEYYLEYIFKLARYRNNYGCYYNFYTEYPVNTSQFDGLRDGKVDAVFFDESCDQVIAIEFKTGKKITGDKQAQDYAKALKKQFNCGWAEAVVIQPNAHREKDRVRTYDL